MFEVGFTEIVLIFGIALLVLGPARLPKLAADLGRWAGRARAMARQLRTQLEQEVQFDPLATGTGSKPGQTSPPPYTPPPAPAPGTATHEARATPAQSTDVIAAAAPAGAAGDPTAVASASTDQAPTTVPDERQPG